MAIDRIEVAFGPYKATVQFASAIDETVAREVAAVMRAVFERRCGL